MNDRDWINELSRFLHKGFLQLCEFLGHPRCISDLRINPPLAIEEAKYFLLGLESGLFRLDEEGYVQSELLPPPSRGNLKQKMCQIFWHNPPPPHLFRESICQLATASLLILERGWLPDQIQMEPTIGEYGGLAYGVDIVAKSPAGKILVCVEIKRSIPELRKLSSDFRQCCKRGGHAKADCAFQQNHAKYEFCARHKPTYLWAVAPGDEACFKLSYANEMIELEELETLPPRSHIEFGLS